MIPCVRNSSLFGGRAMASRFAAPNSDEVLPLLGQGIDRNRYCLRSSTTILSRQAQNEGYFIRGRP